MAVVETRFKLNTGAEIPALGLGTWQSAPGEVENAVKHALVNGYRHVDGAMCYANEDEVGKGLAAAFESGAVKREDVFVTTKLWCSYHTKAKEGLEKSLKDLGLDYVDLYLMHWPVAMNPNGTHHLFPKLPNGERDLWKDRSHIDTWKDMEELMKTGKVRAIGVANYSKRYLEQLLPHATIKPAVNQIENHPSLPQQEIVDFCKEHDIHVTAYSPLGSTGGPLLTAEPVVAVANKKGVTPASVLLSWHIARGSSVLAKSVNPARIDANRNLVALDAEDMETIAKYSNELEKNKAFVRYVYPPFGVDFGFPDKS